MTDEDWLERYYEDRSILENDLEHYNDVMKAVESKTDLYEEDSEYNGAWDAFNETQNELTSIEGAIRELEEKLGVKY